MWKVHRVSLQGIFAGWKESGVLVLCEQENICWHLRNLCILTLLWQSCLQCERTMRKCDVLLNGETDSFWARKSLLSIKFINDLISFKRKPGDCKMINKYLFSLFLPPYRSDTFQFYDIETIVEISTELRIHTDNHLFQSLQGVGKQTKINVMNPTFRSAFIR